MICKNCGAHFEDLSEAVPKMYTKELKTQTGQLRKIFLIVGGLIAALALLFFLMFFLSESMYKKDAKAEILFTKEAFPVNFKKHDFLF